MKEHNEILRQKVRLAKAYNKEWSYRQMAEVINITNHSFYNWLNGYYELSSSKLYILEDLIDNLLD